MKLFDDIVDKTKNWLPQDGTVNYFGKLLTQEKADLYFGRLLEDIEWKNDEAILFGKKIMTKRKVAWYGEKAYAYTYSNTTNLSSIIKTLSIGLNCRFDILCSVFSERTNMRSARPPCS